MHLITTLPSGDVARALTGGSFECFKIDQLRQSRGTTLSGDWKYGVFRVEEIDEEDQSSLQQDLGFPGMQTRLWISCEPSYQGQTVVYELTAEALKKWLGDLALLHDGDSPRVQRISGQISLRADYLNPERLVFYQDFDWKPLPAVKE